MRNKQISARARANVRRCLIYINYKQQYPFRCWWLPPKAKPTSQRAYDTAQCVEHLSLLSRTRDLAALMGNLSGCVVATHSSFALGAVISTAAAMFANAIIYCWYCCATHSRPANQSMCDKIVGKGTNVLRGICVLSVSCILNTWIARIPICPSAHLQRLFSTESLKVKCDIKSCGRKREANAIPT